MLARGAPLRRGVCFLLLAAGWAAALAASAEVLEGRVVAVHDGDTISVLLAQAKPRGEAPVRVRLSGIDTPERGQPWADRARRALSARIFGRQVRVIEVAVDAYGRTVGEVYADAVCVGCELVREGHAWVYRKYSDDAVLLRLEAEARARGVGLWSLPESQRVPPWQWRADRRGDAAQERQPPRPECDRKRTCGEMSSCDEARYYLEHCGLRRLDGDDDGTPCEKLCGGS